MSDEYDDLLGAQSSTDLPPTGGADGNGDWCTSENASGVTGSFFCGVRGLWSEAGKAVSNVTANLASGAGQVAGAASDATTNIFNPANAASAGAGLGLGLVLAASGVAIVGGVAVDQLVFGGAGWTSLSRRIAGRKR